MGFSLAHPLTAGILVPAHRRRQTPEMVTIATDGPHGRCPWSTSP
jgi:hypothetical protein